MKTSSKLLTMLALVNLSASLPLKALAMIASFKEFLTDLKLSSGITSSKVFKAIFKDWFKLSFP